ncbi:retention module-containing protein [Marinomonas sp. RSW2]|uniref:Retention module-containing protein n=1 Tax=Marinomonas maritima TaxID=2940935 RepID=A0ABT5WDM8_9GAMM|nr:retention module-containing protein [Marinomonas maritima]MDE8602915.1 retention module-containing protein [Marinomonas maritima]
MSDNQIPFATMGNAIGFVTKLNGSVTIESIDGQERIVKLGDPIFFGETVVTGSNSSVTIEFIDGTDVVIGGDSIIEMTDEIYNTGDNEDLVADSSSEIDALQRAILAGDDPTLIQDAPAAGNALADQQRFDVSIERNDAQNSLPTYGYDTGNGSGGQGGESQYSDPSLSRALNQNPLLINLDIDPITGDSIINAAEAGGIVTLTGVVNGDVFSSGVVTLVINGVTYSTNVNPNGTWSVGVAGSDLSADSDRIVDASVVVTNGAGQQGTADSTESFIVKTSSRATISVNSITSDDVINAEESNSTITVSGRVGLDASAGDTVSMTINGTLYTTVVLANKTWSVGVSGSDLAQDDSFQVSVAGQDSAGNPYTGTTTSTHTVDTEGNETTVDADGNWTVDVAGSDLAADTVFDVNVASTDDGQPSDLNRIFRAYGRSRRDRRHSDG